MSAGYKKINLALKTQLKKIDKDGYHNPSTVNDDKLEKLKKVLLRKVSSNQNESAILPNVLKYNYQETPGHYKDKNDYNKINIMNPSKTTSRRKININDSSVKSNHVNSSIANNGKDYVTFLNTQKTTLKDSLKDKFYLRKNSVTRSPRSTKAKDFIGDSKNFRQLYQKDELKAKTTNSKNDVKNYKIDFSYIYDKNGKREYNASHASVNEPNNGQTTNKSMGRKINESIKSKRNLTSNSNKDNEPSRNTGKLVLTPNNNQNFDYKALQSKNRDAHNSQEQRYYISPSITKKSSDKRNKVVSKTVDISNLTNSQNLSNINNTKQKSQINHSYENESAQRYRDYGQNTKKIKIDKGYLVDATMNISKNVKENMINSMNRRNSAHRNQNTSQRNSRASVNRHEERESIKIPSLNNSAYEVTRRREDNFTHDMKLPSRENVNRITDGKHNPVQFYLTDTTKNKRNKNDEPPINLRNSSIVTRNKKSTESLRKPETFGGIFIKTKAGMDEDGRRPPSSLKLD